MTMEKSGRPKREIILKHLCDSDFQYDIPKITTKRRKKVIKEEQREKRPFQCEHCPRTFKDQELLFEHEEVHFETEEVYECKDCEMIFASKASLSGHQRLVHDCIPSSRFSCDSCGKTFLQKSGLRAHLSIHTGEKPFKCPICNVGFRLNSSLQRHVGREHYTTKPYKCSECGKDFGHNSDLAHHVRSVHATERLFVCQICYKKFTSNVVLMRHINIHFDLKLSECKICGAKFSHSGSLHHHMKVHSTERSFHCETCGKSYKLKSHLKNHNCTALKKKGGRGRPLTKSIMSKDYAEGECLQDSKIASVCRDVQIGIACHVMSPP